jgi:putative DNA primase/helicase
MNSTCAAPDASCPSVENDSRDTDSPNPVPVEHQNLTIESPSAVPHSPLPSSHTPDCEIRASDTPHSALPTPPSEDSATFQRLALLTPAQYDRVRRTEARRLRIRFETLDAEVARCRAGLALDTVANALRLPVLEPLPDPVSDAPELLDLTASRFANYLFLPPGAPDAFALWTAHTHAFSAFHQTPRLNLLSPHGGCGKTTTLDVLASMTPRPLRTENMSAAVLFRLVDQFQPTLLLDEVDTYLHQAEELRGLLNAGHKRGACAYRCEGDGNSVRAFNAFAPAALAGIGSLPATLQDRSICIPLVAAPQGRLPAHFDPLHTELEHIIARKLARWSKDNFDALAAANPPLPDGAFNRLADNWRPLLAIAQVAGADWPQRALDAFAKLSAGPTLESHDISLHLLADIRGIFAQAGAERLFSSALVDSLCAIPCRPWSGSGGAGKAMSETWLARRLSPLGIRSQTMRIGRQRARGYMLADFLSA